MTRRRTALAVAALLLPPVVIHAQPQVDRPTQARGENVYLAGPDVGVTREVRGDLVAAGGTVRVDASVAETAIVAGGNVTFDGAVGDDVLAAGGEVVLGGHVADDARLVGGTVRIAGRVDGDATAAGGTVRIERDGLVGGRAWLAGGEIVVAGTIERQLGAAGRRVYIDGTVGGDVQVDADALDIGPTARISGNVVHRGAREPRIAPGARIDGRVEHRASSSAAPGAGAIAMLAWLLLLPALFLTGAAMIVGFPRFTPAAAQTIETDPWRSLGVGALALLGAPLAMVALFATGIGIPLGLILLAAYSVALLLGYLVAALFVGMFGARRLRARSEAVPSRGALTLRLLAGLVVLGLLQLVPFLGGLVSFAALLFGMGALVLRLYRTYRGERHAEPIATR
jgi:cytoskeletal protein CcmA (bactofilin family)